MAVGTFHTLIARNRRNSFLLIAGFMLFFVAVGLLIGMVWGDGSWVFGAVVAGIAAMVAFVLTLASFYFGIETSLNIGVASKAAVFLLGGQ